MRTSQVKCSMLKAFIKLKKGADIFSMTYVSVIQPLYYTAPVLNCKLTCNFCISIHKFKQTPSNIPSVLLSYYFGNILMSLNSVVPLWSTEIVSFIDLILSVYSPANLSWRSSKQVGSSKPWSRKLWRDIEGGWWVIKVIALVLKG